MSKSENTIESVESETTFKLKKPFEFEDGIIVSEIDLSVLENVSKKDIKSAIKFFSQSKDKSSEVPFLDFDYNLNVLAIALGQPIEYFDNIGGADYQQLATKVMSFLNN